MALPKPYDQYVLTGKSRAAWHTSFVIPQLNLLLDAGLCVNKLRPKHVFLTHGHNDHTLLAPAFVKREDPPDIYCPAEVRTVFDQFILSNSILNLGGLVGPHESPGGQGAVSDGAGQEPASSPPRDPSQSPSVAHKLKPEYTSLPGQQLKALRESGVEITAPQSTPFLAFMGDTTAETLAAEPEWLREGIPVVITECSFLYPEHRSQAVKTKHTLWSDLEKVIRKWPKTTFVLMHFSLRYKDKDVRRFFKEMIDPPTNIVIWVDGEDQPDGFDDD
ncbi:unnamed protein product [Parascedosporium putredinis]|uniref:Metallo-beta-lactamase domain-containing protein n=1 Tax=Parascedosporium putredinis TaxID=1442378 RepID=A0A9P1GX85_9PEZI|nr:unnamed protein product [Parascedosporium putredinis]CAI7989445.1 unnamed protein product [Parascedosporium putredinis]